MANQYTNTQIRKSDLKPVVGFWNYVRRNYEPISKFENLPEQTRENAGAKAVGLILYNALFVAAGFVAALKGLESLINQ